MGGFRPDFMRLSGSVMFEIITFFEGLSMELNRKGGCVAVSDTPSLELFIVNT